MKKIIVMLFLLGAVLLFTSCNLFAETNFDKTTEAQTGYDLYNLPNEIELDKLMSNASTITFNATIYSSNLSLFDSADEINMISDYFSGVVCVLDDKVNITTESMLISGYGGTCFINEDGSILLDIGERTYSAPWGTVNYEETKLFFKNLG